MKDRDQFESLQHEAGDRAFVISKQFADFILAHPFVAESAPLKAIADKIGDDLGKLYQAIWTTEAK